MIGNAAFGFMPRRATRIMHGAYRPIPSVISAPRTKLTPTATANYKAFLALRQELESFEIYLRSFVGGKPMQNRWRTMAEVPARTTESDAMGRDLVRRGFKFVGSTICYALMQATGMVNDHLVTCPRHAELGGAPRRK